MGLDLKRGPADQQEIQSRAETVHVALRSHAVPSAFGLFRAHVGGSTEGRPGPREVDVHSRVQVECPKSESGAGPSFSFVRLASPQSTTSVS